MRYLPIAMLFASNIFMSFAWYGHLKFTKAPLFLAVLASWSIALIEYLFAVPANRIGVQYYNVSQLKIMQEVITLTVFAGFSVLFLNQEIKINYLYAFLCMAAAVYFIFQ